jgi:sulfur carrier protein
MLIFLNNNPIELTIPISIPELLKMQNIPAERGIAIAVNNTVIQKKHWDDFQLNEADKITIIKATQGG